MFNYSMRTFVALFLHLSVSSVNAQTRVVVIPLFGDDAPSPTVYAIGDTGPGGGIVFDVTPDGLNGLEAALADQGTAPWNCFGVDVAGVDNITSAATPDSNSGAANTPLIAVQCPQTSTNAAVLAAVYVWPNGQTGGFLPNKEQLNLLYAQSAIVGGFSDGGYWSSSEFINTDRAWIQGFDTGSQISNSKSAIFGVRAVRAF